MNTLHLTFDQDWAPAWATLDVHHLLQEHGQTGTLFVTHPCASLPTLKQADTGLAELGWHPNYLPGSSHGETPEEVLDTLQQWVPDPVGVRAHFLVRSTVLWSTYAKRGLLYEASDLMDGLTHLRPLKAWNNLTRLPIFWEDDVHAAHGLPFTLDAIELDQPGLKIFDFHPIHIALNTSIPQDYQALKDMLKETGTGLTDLTRDQIKPLINTRAPGARDMLLAVLRTMKTRPEVAGGMMKTLVQA